MPINDFPLHRLGWKAFQDLCIAIVEQQVNRPVQTFIATNDAGRDGAFRGNWDGLGSDESTIQCKFTSIADSTLSLSDLEDELGKVKALVNKGLASDYVILTNHRITGRSELAIKMAFRDLGVGNCRVFHKDWIVERLHQSPKLRMMVPRLYGLLDLTGLLDDRAYRQAQLILSEMGDNLQKLVVTEAHRKSVRAISEHSLVLLLGSPAAGKSTIGASLALGASDTWKSSTIKSTSPQHLERHIDTSGGQFFWIDDAWGSTQYQRERTESWNQVFPLMQGAMRHGTRFLITSRDYIWHQAKRELKIQGLPVLGKSQVIINVHELTFEEKARILYNHLKLGDQSPAFRKRLYDSGLLPDIATRADFLPESARRLGTRLFTGKLSRSLQEIPDFFARPKEFLEETIENLAAESRAAIGLVFLNGGQVRSPVPEEMLERPGKAFDVSPANIRAQLEMLNGSMLNLIQDEEGPYWTYQHPTISDAFASYVAKSPELVEIYLRGAKPETMVQEVVCAGIKRLGAAVIVPNSLQDLLVDRIASLSTSSLVAFISYRSNKSLTEKLMKSRPDLWRRLNLFSRPLDEDPDVDLLTTLHKQTLLPEHRRLKFVEEVKAAATEDADVSFIESEDIASVLTEEERTEILVDAEKDVLGKLESHVERVKKNWDSEYEPDDHFDRLRKAVVLIARELDERVDLEQITRSINLSVERALDDMRERYDPPASSTSAATQPSAAKPTSIDDLFRDVYD